MKIKTSEGCAFSGSDMQSNPMPQSLGRKDKRQALPWLAVCGAGRGRGLRRAQGGAWHLGDHGFASQEGGRAAWSRGKRVVRREGGLEFHSISEPSWSVLSLVLLDHFPAGGGNCSIFFPFLPRSQRVEKGLFRPVSSFLQLAITCPDLPSDVSMFLQEGPNLLLRWPQRGGGFGSRAQRVSASL